MKRLFALVVGVLALSAMPAFAAEQAEPIHKATLTLPTAIVVGDQTLKPGEYKFECRMVDGKHVMVFMDSKGTELAKVPCVPTPLDAKVSTTEYRTRTQADGSKALLSVRIKNESIAHTVGQS